MEDLKQVIPNGKETWFENREVQLRFTRAFAGGEMGGYFTCILELGLELELE